VNKAEFVAAIADKTGASKGEAEKFVNAFVNVISENISNKEGIRLMGFGTLSVSERKERMGRNPATGEIIKIESRFAPVFRASKELKQAANRLDREPGV
jgi:DNA-binding protein HU-beta